MTAGPRGGALLVCALLLGCQHGSTVAGLGPREAALHELATGRPERALQRLEPLSLAAPDDLDLARHLVQAYVKSGRSGELMSRLQTGEARRPEYVRCYMRGLLHFASPAQAVALATAELGKAIELAPRIAELHYRLGLIRLEAEQFDLALAPLERATELAPEETAFQLPLAKALARTGDTEGAVAAVRRAIAGTPSTQEVKLARGLMDELTDPFVRFPQAARPKLETGLAALRERDAPQEAIVALEEILQDYPDLAVVHALLGLAFMRIDDVGRALDELKRAVELAPQDGKNHLYLADFYRARQRPQQARAEYDKALMRHPLLDSAYFQAGDLALEAGDLPSATERFRVLTRILPDAPAPRGKLALVLQMSGDYLGAERELRQVLTRHPGEVEFMLRLGMLLAEKAEKIGSLPERKANREEAEKLLREVLQKQPDNALASRALESLQARN